MLRKLIISGEHTFVQSELIPFHYHCVELRCTLGKQAADPAPWCAWRIEPGKGVVFLTDPETGHVATYEAADQCAEAAVNAYDQT